MIGTVAPLAFDLVIWTGQRGGDVRKMGPASVRDTRLELTQEKTKVFVSLPIMPGLADSILATPTVGAFFLVTTHALRHRSRQDAVKALKSGENK